MKNVTWRSLNDQLNNMSEEEVLELLNKERAGSRRATLLERLHQRYTILRSARERAEIFSGAEKI